MTRARSRLAALAAAVLTGAGALVAAAPPAAAVSCQAGSTTFRGQNTTLDGNGNHVAVTADDYGTNANTCVLDTDSGGPMGGPGTVYVTQANATPSQTDPTSFPSTQYGCSLSFCAFGWTSQLWSSDSEHLAVTWADTYWLNPNWFLVNTADKYDFMVDQFFGTKTGTFGGADKKAEIEVVVFGNPSYDAIGMCHSTACDPTGPHTISGVTGTWWEKTKTAVGCNGTCSWPDYLLVRSTMTHSVSNLCMSCFRSYVNGLGGGGNLSTWNLMYEAPGFELWPAGSGTDGGLNLNTTAVAMTSEP